MSPSVRARRYAEAVSKGRISACRFVKLAARRFLKDLKRKRFAYRYDPELADRACNWIEKMPHVKGQWAARRERLVLDDWQIFITCQLFGWINKKTGNRRFRKAYVEVGRKNGKSAWAAAIGLFMLCADGEYGAEVYSGATTEKQAWEIFRPARQMCQRLPDLKEAYGIEVNAKTLAILHNGSRFEPVIGKPGDGASPSCALVDEFHEHSSSDLVDTMQTGMGAREQPLLLIVTTAGSNFGGPCYETRSEVIKLLEGQYQDETVFGIIYTIDEGDKWDSIESLKKANPNYGISVSAEFLQAQMAEARRSALRQNAFKTKHLNLWVGAKTAYLNMLHVQRCINRKLTLESLRGAECVVGLDLASKVDIASMVAAFNIGGVLKALVRRYLPEDAVREDANPRYQAWADAGLITLTPGAVIDFDFIEEDLRELATICRVREVAYDPYQATQFASHLDAEGFTMVEVRPTVLNFSEPMKDLEARTRNQTFEYDGDPVLTWMFGNVVAFLDAKDNVYPRKEREENKIDDVVALIMANQRLMAGPEVADHTAGLLVI